MYSALGPSFKALLFPEEGNTIFQITIKCGKEIIKLLFLPLIQKCVYSCSEFCLTSWAISKLASSGNQTQSFLRQGWEVVASRLCSVPMHCRTSKQAHKGRVGQRTSSGCFVGLTVGRDKTCSQGRVRIKSKCFSSMPSLIILTIT